MMNRCIRPLATCLVISALTLSGRELAAQPLGSGFTYQGQLKELGQPASGLYDLQVCLFDSASNPIPIQCAQDFNDVPVEAGLFAITLDFGSAPFSGQQRFLELRVRPGASVSGYTVLAPRQVIRPAPEALRANATSTAPWSGLTGVPSGFADGIDDDSGGTVTSVATGAGLTGGPITGSGSIAVAPGGIGAVQIDPTEVQSRVTGSCAPGSCARHINQDGSLVCDPAAVGSVTSIATGAGLTGGPITGSGSVAVAPGGIGAALVNSAQVQLRVSGACAVGQTIAAINTDGTVQCAVGSTAPRQSAHFMDVGASRFTSTTLDPAGNPVIVTLSVGPQGSGSGLLNIFRCHNAACTTLPSLTKIDIVSSSMDAGVGADGIVRVGFSGGSPVAVRYLRCANIACTSFTNRPISSGSGGHRMSSRGMALDSAGLATFVAEDQTDQTLMFRRCLDVQCNSLGPQQRIAGAAGATPSIAFRADGRPVIASGTHSQVSISQCSDADCVSPTVNTFARNGHASDVVVPIDDRPIVAAMDNDSNFGSSSLYLHRCDTQACTSITSRFISSSPSQGLLKSPRIWLSSEGLPVIAFGVGGGNSWQLASCADMNCNSVAVASVPIVNAAFSGEADATPGMDGFPFIAAQNVDADLRVVKCFSSGCE